MENEDKVFSSDIERGQKPLKNNLYELLQLDPAQPTTLKNNQDNGDPCIFQPKPKDYVPKKRSKFTKVRTVRDIRNEFEEDCQSYLPQDILTQENQLFVSIRNGSLRREKTVKLAQSLIKGDQPLSRSSWQMLMNINPGKHNHSAQFLLWNGTKIRINGSRGGEKKFLFNYDLARKKMTNKSQSSTRQPRKTLLRTLAVNFKPGPLSRKRNLDKSYQKFNVGKSELMRLPKIGLDVQPRLGIAVEPTISDILTSHRQNNDRLTENWALFAVSTLGTLQDSGIKQQNNDTITFDMSYTNDQNQILMRRDFDIPHINLTHSEIQKSDSINNADIVSQVTAVINDMLSSVEISLIQDEMYTGIDEPRMPTQDKNANPTTMMKDKPRKKMCELQRLDVTVIRLSDSPAKEVACSNPSCTLGCICATLENEFNFKNHCGKFDCMFECKCDFSRFKVASNSQVQSTELIPGLLNLDSKINSKLAKEEKKFHQTVVVTETDSILLKAKRRSSKIPKRYAECIDSAPKNGNIDSVSILVSKLDCKNVEPWCMVHNLYKCFCKGRYTDCVKTKEELKNSDIDLQDSPELISPAKVDHDECRTNVHKRESRKTSVSSSISNYSDVVYERTTYISTCARTKGFEGRRFSDEYYSEMNVKITEMEENDKGLQSKLLEHITKLNVESCTDTENSQGSCGSSETVENDVKSKASTALSNDSTESTKSMPNKTKLINWLEANYKNYKRRIETGQKSIPLEAPKLGKIALYPWDVILERYKLKKNYFVVTQEPPYRIFIAVDLKNPFLSNCINIDQIPFDDLRKYPITIKNLLDDSIDLKDNFYIMCGLSHCWELIGSVTKLRNRVESEQSDGDNSKSPTVDHGKTQEKDCNFSFKNLDSDKIDDLMAMNFNKVDKSKWFFMTIENDFSEIQFHTRGFFVKHENIIKAVNVARVSGKTVRLSSQKFNQSPNKPQFGIYAIPHVSEACAFVGPYEQGDLLEIETVMTKSLPATEKRSRGVWISTNKSDDVKVIDEPLAFMPQIKDRDDVITLDKTKVPMKRPSSDISEDTEEIKEDNKCDATLCKIDHRHISDKKESPLVNDAKKYSNKDKCVAKLRKLDHRQVSDKKQSPAVNNSTTKHAEKDESRRQIFENNQSPMKVVKPIKIRKSNGFYQLASLPSARLVHGMLKPVSLLRPLDKEGFTQLVLPSTSTAVNQESYPVIQTTFSLSDAADSVKGNIDQIRIKPIAEIAPQIKINSNNVTATQSNSAQYRSKGMLILKPEEINQRHSESKLFGHPNDCDTGQISEVKEEDVQHSQEMDIENFLATSDICTAPMDSIYVSDDEDGHNITAPMVQDVWIECQNIQNLGCLKGRKDSKNELSFEFPGFKFTEFYPEDEAFTKINQ